MEFHDPAKQDLYSMEEQRPGTGAGQTQLLPVCDTGSKGLRSGQRARLGYGMGKELMPKVIWKTQWAGRSYGYYPIQPVHLLE